eukprot:TRINITY_DN6875_c0_g1_i1.p3 TRINITY_DN6875_c0_g1~~TRINITY_DN6875_c0_g1_i1.p3  ORF type:complete len:67 (+),score=14.45 TRINITY_DN6875_c0_g1_i1:229-429(+)
MEALKDDFKITLEDQDIPADLDMVDYTNDHNDASIMAEEPNAQEAEDLVEQMESVVRESRTRTNNS